MKGYAYIDNGGILHIVNKWDNEDETMKKFVKEGTSVVEVDGDEIPFFGGFPVEEIENEKRAIIVEDDGTYKKSSGGNIKVEDNEKLRDLYNECAKGE